MSDKIEQLKELVSQLQAKIEKLESQASSQVKETVQEAKAKVAGATGLGLTPAQHLRVVLLGPPGSGKLLARLLLSLSRPIWAVNSRQGERAPAQIQATAW